MTEQEVNLYLREIIDTMNDGMFLTRPDGSIAMVNPALLRMTGYEREELVGRPCSVLDCDACDRSRAEGRTHWCRLFHTKKETLKNCHIRRKDGTYAHVVKNASLLVDENGRELGAVETLTDITELDVRDRTIETLSRLAGRTGFHGLVGDSPAMQLLCGLLEKAAASEAPVILYGESGTGKELAAAAIHELGARKQGPFVRINCAALNESLLESEIFGHVKGAFTGAYRHRTGRFEEASGGDVLLDEIGDVPLSIQVKLLRVLETRTFERVGDNRPLALDARIITATNQDLPRLVAEKRFRDDFFYRINVIPIHLPPLREHMEDLPLLARHFLEQRAAQDECAPALLSPGALRACMGYSWPGNVRELKSALEYAQVVSEGGVIEPDHLPRAVTCSAGAASGTGPDLSSPRPVEVSAPPASEGRPAGGARPGPAGSAVHEPPRGQHPEPDPGGGPYPAHEPAHQTIHDPPHEPAERSALVAALTAAGGNQSEAARRLGVSRATVLNRMRKHGVELKKVVGT